jgi:Putative phage metallopeptidase
MTTKTKPARKLKPVSVRFIKPDSEIGQRMYALLRELVLRYHDEIADAKIALAWQTTWQPDVDGRVTLGQCKKVGDLEREVADLHAFDFVILLQQEFWQDPRVTETQRRALLDHELTHAAVKLDEAGDAVIDECGRVAYRVRKHDLEEFSDIAARYGCWKRDLEVFASALDRARAKPPSWVGYTRLREQLIAVGATIPLDTIRSWSETERRTAQTWAEIRLELPTSIDFDCPAHVTAGREGHDDVEPSAETHAS